MREGEDEMRRAITWTFVAAALAAGCGQDFAPFNEVTGLRVLAVRAEPPAITSGETAALDALVYEPDGDAVTYAWSWCPATLGAATGFACALPEADLVAALEQLAPGASALVPAYDMGTGPTAAFPYAIPAAAVGALCDAIAAQSAPAFVALPDCGDSLTITVRLEVSAGGESVTAVKQLHLLLEGATDVNENPSIGDAFAAPTSAGVDPRLDGVALSADAASALVAGKRYDLAVEVPEDASQLFTPAPTADEPNPAADRETLFLTWFVTGGETDAMRTGFIDGDASMDGLEENVWKTPDLASSGGTAELILVLQDERGGAAWTRRSIALSGR
jgi:hypothetical protein